MRNVEKPTTNYISFPIYKNVKIMENNFLIEDKAFKCEDVCDICTD